jgi:hypothetical protein
MSLMGRKKRERVLQRGDKRAERQRTRHHPSAADPDDQRRGQRADQFDRRVEHRVVEDRLDVRIAIRAVDAVEFLEITRLAPEQLHRCHAGDALLQVRVDSGDPGAHRPVRLAHVRAEPLRDQPDERQHGERDDREAPIDPDHHCHDPDQREQIAEDGDDASREQVVQDVDVCRDARHQAADGIPVVEAQVEPLQVFVDLHPQVKHDSLPGQLQQPRLQVIEYERSGKRREIQRGDERQPLDVAPRNVAIDDELDEIGRRQLEHRMSDDGGRRQHDVRFVRPQVRDQTPHQSRVVRFSENVFVVNGHYEAASSSSSSCLRYNSAYNPLCATS